MPNFSPFISNILKNKIRSGLSAEPPVPTDQATVYFEEVRLHDPGDPVQGPYIMPLATLQTRPCQWSKSGGCVMCGYHLGAGGDKVSEKDLLVQTQNIINRLPASIYPSLVFTSNGSFLDNREVSDSLRPRLVRKLGEAGYRFLVTETRPEFVTRQRLEALLDAFCPHVPTAESKPISISMGLESSDDFILQYCLNKGNSRDDYLPVIELLKDMRISFDCYILLGKPFLTPEEDIEDALSTIQFAVEQGAGYVFVMVTNLTRYSLTEYLFEKGMYQLPSLWRAVKLIQRLSPRYRYRVLVKGISHAPVSPLRYATSCELCSSRVKDGLNFWNMTGDIGHLNDIIPCSCQQGKAGRMVNVPPLSERIREAYSFLAQEFDVPESNIPTIPDYEPPAA